MPAARVKYGGVSSPTVCRGAHDTTCGSGDGVGGWVARVVPGAGGGGGGAGGVRGVGPGQWRDGRPLGAMGRQRRATKGASAGRRDAPGGPWTVHQPPNPVPRPAFVPPRPPAGVSPCRGAPAPRHPCQTERRGGGGRAAPSHAKPSTLSTARPTTTAALPTPAYDNLLIRRGNRTRWATPGSR
jgi:hypothetical protein